MLCLLLLCLTREVPKWIKRKKETSLHDKYFHNNDLFLFHPQFHSTTKMYDIHSKNMIASTTKEANHVNFKNPQPDSTSLVV